MSTIVRISRHSSENCPMINEKMKKITREAVDKLPTLTKKHGIKRVGSWSVFSEHLIIQVFETPSVEAFLNFQMELEIIKWTANTTTETKIAMTQEESMKLLKQAK
jgi:uncharacterized protein with GYD domain